MMTLACYFARLPWGKAVLWCYLIWYAVNVAAVFDPSPAIWLNAMGISAVIGAALMLSVQRAAPTDSWQTFRLFLMPFCVSSFSSLIKGRGYVLVFPTNLKVLGLAVGSCAVFMLIRHALRMSLGADK